MEKFDLNYQWNLYLEKIGLKEESMFPIQLTETKRAFFAACGQMLLLLRDDIPQYKADKAIEILENMTMQVKSFWEVEVKKQYGAK